jgi:signal transduction histidine kinase/CheY-like chemotaxis protein
MEHGSDLTPEEIKSLINENRVLSRRVERMQKDLKNISSMNEHAMKLREYSQREQEHQKAELALAHEESEIQLLKMNLMMKATKIALWDVEVTNRDDPTNPENKIVWTEEFIRLLGFEDKSEFPDILSSWSDRLHPDDKEKIPEALGAHMFDKTGETPFDVEYRLQKKDGSYGYFRASGETIRDGKGNPLRTAGALMDISEAKNILIETERLRIEAEDSNKAKSAFLSTMSHEMRTPMNAIIGMTAIGKASLTAERKDYCLNKIENASQHLLAVISDILDMSKIEANKFELSAVDFNFEKMLQRVSNVIGFRADEKQQKFMVRIDPEIPEYIVGDDQRLAQVLINLLGNAVKFTAEEGSVRLDALYLGEEDGVCTVMISVSDNGIGIKPKQLGNLFSVFYQAESDTTRVYGGTGLGLAISKNIVDLMGGRIWVDSEPGKGSVFRFTFKTKRSSLCDSVSGKPVIGGERKAVSFLAVDDDPVVLDYFREIMGRLGIACDTAQSGKQALRLAEKNKGYDIYFIDWSMPFMNGITLSKLLKSSKDVPDSVIVLMISVFEISLFEEEAKKAGADIFLHKPLFPADVADAVNESLAILKSGRQKSGEAAETASKTELPEHGDIFSGRRILLAEDVEINREILLMLLEPTRVDIDCAENGEQAVNMYRESPDKYDLIFMDVQMPLMDGYEATRKIRSLDIAGAEKIPIIAMTANVFREDVNKCLAAGMNAHLGKPLNYEDVVAKLREYL